MESSIFPSCIGLGINTFYQIYGSKEYQTKIPKRCQKCKASRLVPDLERANLILAEQLTGSNNLSLKFANISHQKLKVISDQVRL